MSQHVLDVPVVNQLYQQGLPTKHIANTLGVQDDLIRRVIHRERKRDPSAWPYRKPGVGKHAWHPPDSDAIREAEQQEREQVPVYLAGELLDLTWSRRDLERFDTMWKSGLHIVDIAEHFGRPVSEVVFLLIDRAEAGRIQSRSGGVWGRDAPGVQLSPQTIEGSSVLFYLPNLSKQPEVEV